MYSVIHEGKVLDFKYVKHQDNCYKFYVGDIFIGLVWKMGKTYHATVYHDMVCECSIRSVSGFATRYAASEYMLKTTIYNKNT